MDFWQVLDGRRTTRRFNGPPSPEQLERLLEAGSKAPSAGNRQAWFVVVVDDAEMISQLGDIKKAQNAYMYPDTEKGRAQLQVQKDAFHDCVSLVVYTFAPDDKDPHRYDMGSAWLSVENISLAAEAEGLGSQIVAFWDEGEAAVNRLLKAPPRYQQVVSINVGMRHPDYEPPQKVLKSKAKYIFRNQWPDISAD